MVVVVVVVVVVGPPPFSLFSVAFQLAGLTTPAGCKFLLTMTSRNIHLCQTYSDNANGGRVLTTVIPGNPNNTIQLCVAACIQQNFTVAGTEYSGT